MAPHLRPAAPGLALAAGAAYCGDEDTPYREGKLEQSKTSRISPPLVKQNYKYRHKNSHLTSIGSARSALTPSAEPSNFFPRCRACPTVVPHTGKSEDSARLLKFNYICFKCSIIIFSRWQEKLRHTSFKFKARCLSLSLCLNLVCWGFFSVGLFLCFFCVPECKCGTRHYI